MVPAQVLASLALCWQPQRHYGVDGVERVARVDGVEGAA